MVQGRRWVVMAWKISARTTEDMVYLVHFLDDPGPINIPLPPARYMTSTGAVRGSWCLQVHIASAFPRGIQRKVDESRGAAVASWLSSHRRPSIVPHFLGGVVGVGVFAFGLLVVFRALFFFTGCGVVLPIFFLVLRPPPPPSAGPGSG